MIPLELTVTPTARRVGVEHFFEAFRSNNPFAINRVSDPSQMEHDVECIHKRESDELKKRARTAFKECRSLGAMVLGGAGTGKSHLLSRLKCWAEANKTCYVFLHNIQATPDEMDRYLVKCCVSALADDRHDQLHQTQLYQIMDAAIKEAATKEGISEVTTANFDSVSKQLAKRLHGDENVFNVLFKLYSFIRKATAANKKGKSEQAHNYEENAKCAIRWLEGDSLDAAEAKVIDQVVPQGHENVMLRESLVQQVVPMIAHLARAADYGFILCLDEVDSMKHPQTTALAFAWQRLINANAPMLVVVSGVRQAMEKLLDDGIIPETSADRVEYKRPIVLSRIKRDEAKIIIESRLHPFFDQFDQLPEMAKPFLQNDSLFPLGENWFAQLERDSLEFRPRDVLTWAADRWRENQQAADEFGDAKWLQKWPLLGKFSLPPGRTIDEIVAAKFEEAVNSRLLQPGTLPADANNLLGLTEELLEHCIDRDDQYSIRKIEHPKNGKVELIVHEVADDKKVANHLKFVVTGSKTSAAAQLKKLRESQGAVQRILVTDEQRIPLQVGPAGQQHLAELHALGDSFTHIKLDLEQYAQLDAMISVVNEARSGDLELVTSEGKSRPILVQEVIEAHHTADRYRLHPLLQPLICEPTKKRVISTPAPFNESEFREYALAKLAFMMHIALRELTNGYLVAISHEATIEHVLPSAKTIAMKMHDERKIVVKPWNNDLLLEIGPNA